MPLVVAVAMIIVPLANLSADSPPTPLEEPVVARVEMKLAIDEKVVDVIAKGDLLTVLEERENDYVILTHDGSKGAIDKVNAARIAESGDIYTDLIKLNPTEGRYYTLRASSWWALGQVEKALDDFDHAIELGYTEAHAYTSRGLFHAAMGNYDNAISDYNEALKIDSDDLAAVINRAAAYMSRGDYLMAAADYTVVLEQRTNSTAILHQRAIAWKAAGRMDDAAADFDKILSLNSNDYNAVMGLGYIRFQQQQWQQAAETFGKAIELNSEDAVAYNNRGYNRYQIGQFAVALEDYDAAIRLAPEYSLAHQNRAWLLATAEDESIRDPASAVDSARKACELTNFENVGDLSALAAALAAHGDFEGAVGWQEKVVDLVNPNFKSFATKMLKRYQDERPFAIDPDKANAEEKAAAELEAKAKQQARQRAEQQALGQQATEPPPTQLGEDQPPA